MAGNRLSKNGKTWSNFVGRHQSGTGNKQWLHIHTKYDHITLWVLEQTPQKIINKNETDLLYKQGYWISCGIPYYKVGLSFHSISKLFYKNNEFLLSRNSLATK